MQLKIKLTDGNEGDDENSENETKSNIYGSIQNQTITLNTLRSNECNFESLNKTDIVHEEDAENDTENETWEKEMSFDVDTNIESEPYV